VPPVPINSYIIKVASRCNLNCSYCYEYNMGDDSWRSMPALMSSKVVALVAARVREHCENHGLNEVYINLHGGEPLLYGNQRTRHLVEVFTRDLAGVKIHWGVQTNGILLDEEWIDLLDSYDFHLGLSLDGPAEVNDRLRVDHLGRGSHERVMEGVRHLHSRRGEHIFAGCLTVIDPESEPIVVFRHLMELRAKAIDFLLPHGNWDDIPPAKGSDPMKVTPYADWLIPIFDEWFNHNSGQVEIRLFEEIIEHLAGGPGRLETIGLQPVSLISVAVDGSIEAVDTLKSIPGQQVLGLNLATHTFDDAIRHPKYLLRQEGSDSLSPTCQSCTLVKTCGGGYLPHRWSEANQFRNPSVFCADLAKLIWHIRASVNQALSAPAGSLNLQEK
jgi:uncharacterized protein